MMKGISLRYMSKVEYFLNILNSCIESESYTRQILLGMEMPLFNMSKEVTDSTGIEVIYLKKGEKYTENDILTLSDLIIYGNTDLINFYYHILNSKYSYETYEKDIIHITSIGKQTLEPNSLSVLFCNTDIDVYIEDKIKPYLSKLYKYNYWKDLGNSLDIDNFRVFANFINESRLYLDVFETTVYNLNELKHLLLKNTKGMILDKHIKSYNVILSSLVFEFNEEDELKKFCSFVSTFKNLNKFKFYMFNSNPYIDSSIYQKLIKYIDISICDIDFDEYENDGCNDFSIIENKKYSIFED